MAGRVFVHPGPPKTGTTFIQTLLYSNADALRRHGLAVVGSQAQHFNVANELLQTRSRRGKAVPGRRPRGRPTVTRRPLRGG